MRAKLKSNFFYFCCLYHLLGALDKVVLGSRRRPRRSTDILVSHKTTPQDTDSMDPQQAADSLPKMANDLSQTEQEITQLSNSKLGPDVIEQQNVTQPITNEQLQCRAPTSDCGDDYPEIKTESPAKKLLSPFNSTGHLEKDSQRSKWFPNARTSPELRQQTSRITVNGEGESTCSSKRPSLESSKGSCDEISRNPSNSLELPLKPRKSLSDSLLWTVPQSDHRTQNGDLHKVNPPDLQLNREGTLGDQKGRPSPEMQRKPHCSKLNGTPFSPKKGPCTNVPCSKHGDEEKYHKRERTSTHPCFDPMDLPKRRRNAACAVAILPYNGNANDNDFLETKI